ncbi:MAG TPA: hypothetical protein VJV77_11430, partial [Casimicrobiaceae bacterium]|nr:hypothetical protein [Casimicrobiaceae bacterium]
NGGNVCQTDASFDPAGIGTSTITLTQPAGFTTPTADQSIVATVLATIGDRTTIIGKDLQQSVSFTLGSPAPAGNLIVTITSNDPGRLLVSPNATTAGSTSITVFVAAGASIGNYVVQSLAGSGAAIATLSAPGYADGTLTATLQPSGFYISAPGSISANVLDANVGLRACSARLDSVTLAAQTGSPQELRAGLAPVNIGMASSNTLVGTIVNSPQSIAGGTGCTPSATLPGAIQFDPVGAGTSTLSLVQPVGFTTPSNLQAITATVTASGINVPAVTVGKNLQDNASASLQSPAPAGGVVVTLTSGDASKLLLSPNATTAGSASIAVNVAQNATSIPYFVHGLDNTGTVQVTASAAGFSNGIGTITLRPSGFVIQAPGSIATNTLDLNTGIQVCSSQLNPTTLNFVTNQAVRAGLAPASVAVTSANPSVGTIVNSPQSIAGGVGCTPVVTSAGAIQFDPVGAGTSTLSLVQPAGFTTPSNLQAITATVTASGINVPAVTVGKNLQDNSSASLQSPAPAGGVVVTLTSGDPARLLLSPNATTAGSASITVNVGQNATAIPYFVHGLDSTGTVQVTASAAGFSNSVGTITLQPSGFAILSGSFTTNTLDANTAIRVCSSQLNPTTLNRVTDQALRAGLAPVSVAVTSSNTSAGTIVNSPQSIAGGVNCTPTSAGAIQFDPAGAGTSTLSLVQPAGFTTPSNLQTITATVTASGINVPAVTVGKDLQDNTSASLQSPAPAGGVVVTLTSGDPGRLLLSPNATTAGSASITVNVAQNATAIPYFVHGLDSTGTVSVTASAPQFAAGTGTMTLQPSGFYITTPGNFTTTAGAANTNVIMCAARLNPLTLNAAGQLPLRAGISSVSLAVTSSNTAVGAIVNSPQQLNGNQTCTTTTATGFKFDPVGVGTSTLSAVTPAGFSMPSNNQTVTATVNP